MSRGKHAAPVQHPHVGRAVVTTGAMLAVTTGGFAVVTPAQAAPPVPAMPVVAPPAHMDPPAPAQAPAAPAATNYIVQRGDTLGRIATGAGTTWQNLYAANRSVIGGNPNLIFPGQALTVGASPAPAAPAAPPAPAASGAHSMSGDSVVAKARGYLGARYVWGGESWAEGGFDCSGLVYRVMADLGVSMPRTSLAQSRVGERVASLADAQPGDLLFFYSPVGHVAIYVGGGMMISADKPGTLVRVESVWTTPTVIRRVV